MVDESRLRCCLQHQAAADTDEEDENWLFEGESLAERAARLVDGAAAQDFPVADLPKKL